MLQYNKGPHETAIEKLFGARNCRFTECEPSLGPACVMLFSNRCGSNFAADVLASTGRVSRFGEPLNWSFVEQAKIRDGFLRFPDYIKAVMKEKSGPTLGFKATWDQAMMLHRFGILPAMFSDVCWIYVRRRDLLSQAISFSIADQTGAWTSTQPCGLADPIFDFDDIERRVRGLANSSVRALEMLSSFGYEYHEIVYEDFIQDVEAGASRALEDLGLGDGRVDFEAVRFKKQATSRNARFRELYVAELQARVAAEGAI